MHERLFNRLDAWIAEKIKQKQCIGKINTSYPTCVVRLYLEANYFHRFSTLFLSKFTSFLLLPFIHSPSLQMILVKVQSTGVIFKIIQVYMTC